MIDKTISKSQCSGCKMCGDLCPRDCIQFVTDHEGFWYPVVDYDSCGNCGLCVKKCPVLTETTNPDAIEPNVYAAWILDEDIRFKSTSGGVYYALAKTMLNQDGYIVGCVFSDDWKHALHIVGNTQADLDRLYRSKYFQSDTAGIYKKVKSLLDEGKRILFSGTPCQNAALAEFLGRNYDNLVQCDFICRGINSPLAHRAHVKELENKYHDKISFFNFKNKSQGWPMLGLLVKMGKGKRVFKNRYTSAWTRGYIGSNLYMRLSCEYCKFKKVPRISDISFGDFWGLKRDKETMRKGISVVMINTPKGANFYEKTLPLLHSERQTMEAAIKGNECILSSTHFNHENRSEFFRRTNESEECFSKIVFNLEKTNMVKVYMGYAIAMMIKYMHMAKSCICDKKGE